MSADSQLCPGRHATHFPRPGLSFISALAHARPPTPLGKNASRIPPFVPAKAGDPGAADCGSGSRVSLRSPGTQGVDSRLRGNERTRDLRKGGHQIVPAGKPLGEVDGWRLLAPHALPIAAAMLRDAAHDGTDARGCAVTARLLRMRTAPAASRSGGTRNFGGCSLLEDSCNASPAETLRAVLF